MPGPLIPRTSSRIAEEETWIAPPAAATVTSDPATVTSDPATVTSDPATVTSDPATATVTSDPAKATVTSDPAKATVTSDPATGAPGAEQPASRRAMPARYSWLKPIGMDLAARLGVLLAVLTVGYNENEGIARLLRSWDGKWFLLAARYGYPNALPSGYGVKAQSTLGFFPAFPILIKLSHLVTRLSYEYSALLAVGLVGIVASVVIWRLIQDIYGDRVADWGTALVLFSPAAFVLDMVYSEALLIAVAAGCMLALRRRRWVVAGLLAAVAAATDPLGIAIGLPCLAAAYMAIREDGEWRSLLAPILAPAGVVAFFCYLWVRVGTPFGYYIAQRRGWQGGVLFTGLYAPFGYIFDHGFNDIDDTVKAASTLVVAVLLIFFLRRRPPVQVALYVLGVLVLAAASPIISWTPRVALRGFPVIGMAFGRRWARFMPAVLGLSGLLMAILCYLALATTRAYTP